MKKITFGDSWFGPFVEIVVSNEAYICDGCVYPFVVVGTGVISDFDPNTDILPMSQEQMEAIYKNIVDSTQKRLDDFAATRNYSGILSACTYSSSPTSKFQVEGQYCLQQRDATWAKLYQILGEVEYGTRPPPTSYADIEPELPVLQWPT